MFQHHRNRLLIFFLMASVFFTGFVCNESPTSPIVTDGDAYAVYSVVLNSISGDYSPVFVLSDSTVGWNIADRVEYLDKSFPDLKPETLIDYGFSNRRSKRLKRIPDLEITCHLIPHDEEDQWKEEYPDANALIHLSQAGFDRHREQALVYISQYVGPLAAYGRLILLEKRETWFIVQNEIIWMS